VFCGVYGEGWAPGVIVGMGGWALGLEEVVMSPVVWGG